MSMTSIYRNHVLTGGETIVLPFVIPIHQNLQKLRPYCPSYRRTSVKISPNFVTSKKIVDLHNFVPQIKTTSLKQMGMKISRSEILIGLA